MITATFSQQRYCAAGFFGSRLVLLPNKSGGDRGLEYRQPVIQLKTQHVGRSLTAGGNHLNLPSRIKRHFQVTRNNLCNKDLSLFCWVKNVELLVVTGHTTD
jgi:hypothetical protein